MNLGIGFAIGLQVEVGTDQQVPRLDQPACIAHPPDGHPLMVPLDLFQNHFARSILLRPHGHTSGGDQQDWQQRLRPRSHSSPLTRPVPAPPSFPFDAVYLRGREPAMRMSTSLLALCCQSAPEPTCETPISARSRSNASRSLCRSPLLLARFTSSSIAPWIMVREPS